MALAYGNSLISELKHVLYSIGLQFVCPSCLIT